jgi:hypothetical protein
VSSWHRNSVLAVLLASAPAWADQTIEIKALRNPVDKSYRKMVKGMDLFAEMHAMAPNASLRYKLLPRKHDTDMDGIALQIVGDRFKVPVAVAADHTFTLERYPQAVSEDASVRSERRAQSMTWRAEIRTPGLPPDTRRLGDLRLECLVGKEAGLISQFPSLTGWLIDLMRSTRGFCNDSRVYYLFFSERPLFGVTLSAGARRETVSVGRLYAGIAHGSTPKEELPYCDCEVLLDRAYTLPLGDRSWPDETLVELEYMDTPAPQTFLAGSTKADVSAAFGEATAMRFDNGFEVWAYQWGPEQRPPQERTEYVVLFDPSGLVAKTRLRPAPRE